MDKRYELTKKFTSDKKICYHVYDKKYDLSFLTLNPYKPNPYYLTDYFKDAKIKIESFFNVYDIDKPLVVTNVDMADIDKAIENIHCMSYLKISLGHFDIEYELITVDKEKMLKNIAVKRWQWELYISSKRDIEWINSLNNGDICIEATETKNQTDGRIHYEWVHEIRYLPISKFKSHIMKTYNKYARMKAEMLS